MPPVVCPRVAVVSGTVALGGSVVVLEAPDGTAIHTYGTPPFLPLLVGDAYARACKSCLVWILAVAGRLLHTGRMRVLVACVGEPHRRPSWRAW